MKDTVIILGLCIAAIAIGAFLLLFPPKAEEQNTMGNQIPGGSETVPVEVAFRVLAEGDAATLDARKNFAARDEESFERIWQLAYGEDGETMPEIDFDTEYVVGVFAGEKPTGGYAITVTKVIDQGDMRTINATITVPGPGCITGQVLTSPFVFITVPVSGNNLSASDTEETMTCS